MREPEPNPASAKEQAEGSQENVNGEPARKDPQPRVDTSTKPDLEGKTDSGPEPEIHGREIPPQQ